MTLSDAEGAVLVGGKDTKANRERFNEALRYARSMEFEAKPGIWWALLDAEPGETNRLGPPRWWQYSTGTKAYRLSGAAFRAPTRWGGLERTLAGLEGALTWSAPRGGKASRRTPEALIPASPGGPGMEVFIPWWQVLRLSGEPVDEAARARGTEGRRYRRRIEDLRGAGYLTPARGEAEAGDTVEIVRLVPGTRVQAAGLVVRASARFCAAYGDGGEADRIPAARLLKLIGDDEEIP